MLDISKGILSSTNSGATKQCETSEVEDCYWSPGLCPEYQMEANAFNTAICTLFANLRWPTWDKCTPSGANTSLTFRDQFAYLPTGSTTAAVIQILHTVTHLLASYDSVSVIALDFTKAFDTVRHSTLLHKMANIAIPDAVYNWLVSYFCNHSHCSTALSTVEVSSTCMLDITAGIIQGSGIGPASYVISYNCRRPENDQQLQLPIQICRWQLPHYTVSKCRFTDSWTYKYRGLGLFQQFET